MISSPEEIEQWWNTRNTMSKAELDFKKAFEHENHSHERVKAMILSGKSNFIEIETPEKLPKVLSDHLIVLQDLSREWVEALGPRLGIPVSVFALHWTDPIDHFNSEVRVPIGQSPTRHFILSYRQSLPFSIASRESDTVKGERKGQLGDMAASESGFCG